MNRIDLKKIGCLLLILIFGFWGTRCATPKEELKTYPKDYVHPLNEINLEKVFQENRGLEVVEENATTAHDYYREESRRRKKGKN